MTRITFIGGGHIGRVAWSRPVGDGTHHLGIELVTSETSRPLRLRYVRGPNGSGAASA